MTDTILIVDDEPDNLDVLNNCLDEAGFEVIIANSGEMALKQVHHITPDLILLDVNMPGMDGFETCLRLKCTDAKDVPVIFVTADTDTTDKIRGPGMGAADYITKPFHPEEVVARINKHLTLRHLQDELKAKNAQLEREIAERVQAEAMLRKSEEKFHSLYSAMEEGVCLHEIVYDESGAATDYRITDVNPAYEAITGISREKVVGRKASELYGTDEPPYIDIYAEVAASGEPASFKTYFPPMEKHFGISVSSLGQGQFATIFFDITDLKQAEGMLRESEDRLRRVVESMPVMMDALDEDFNIITWNRECERITGYSAAEMMENPRPLETLYPDAAYREQMIAELTDLGFCFRDKEYTLTCKDGTEKTISWSNISARFPIPGWHTWAIGVDVTERRQADAALRESEIRLKESQKIARLGQWELDLMTNTLHWSDEIYRLFDIDPRKFSASYEAFLQAIHPDDREFVNRTYTDSLKTKTPYEIIHRLLLKDGTIKYVNEICRTEYDEKGNPLCSVGTVQDITELKRAERALQIERDNFSNILETMDDGIYIVDRHYDIQYVNPVLQKDFGSYEGRKCYVYFHERTAVCPWCKKQEVLEGKTVRSEIHFSRNQRTYDLIGTQLKNPDGSVFKLEILRDITERKQAEEELEKKNKNLEIFNRLAVDREMKMVEIKKEINQLAEEAGQKSRYVIAK